MKQFQIFKQGTHTAANGTELNFSEDDLAAVVSYYDPAVHEAPIVVGHPKDNGPAYGWVSKLDFREGVLIAEPSQVDADFAEMVKAGRFKKRSASFYAPGSKNHPLAGKEGHDSFYLRHVGFLGAAAPAVKGLKEVEFSEDDGVVEFSDDWYVTSIIARLFSGLRDWMLAEHGQEKADQILPKYSIADLEQAARDQQRDELEDKQDAAAGTPAPSFKEDTTMTPEQIAALQAENAQLKADNEKLTADFSELKNRAEAADKAIALSTIKAAIEPHVKAGKVLPAEVDQLASFAASLDDAAATFDFNDGEKTEKVSARALFLAQLGQRAKVVDFGERAKKDAGDDEPDVNTLQRQVNDQVAGRAKK